jgi:hypothetical protein
VIVREALKQQMSSLALSSGLEHNQDHARLQELTSDPASLFADKGMSNHEKLEKFVASLGSFLQNEPAKILQSSHPLRVSDHATFGQLKATLLTSCTCSGVPDVLSSPSAAGVKPTCIYHCADPDLKDVMYELCRSVHMTFGDSWSCFVNIFFDETVSGRGVCLCVCVIAFYSTIIIVYHHYHHHHHHHHHNHHDHQAKDGGMPVRSPNK